MGLTTAAALGTATEGGSAGPDRPWKKVTGGLGETKYHWPMAQVSGKMVALVLRALEARQLPIGELQADLSVSREDLEDGRGGISWEENCRFLERVQELCGGPEGLVDLGRSFNRVQVLGPLQRVSSFALSPAQLYKLVAKWQGPANFPDVATTLERTASGQLVIEIEIRPECVDSVPFFRLTEGALESAPRSIGLGPALIELEIGPRRGRYLITPPPSPSLLARFGRVFELFGASRSAIDHLADQHEELRRSYAALRASEERFRRLAENASDVISEWAEDGSCVYVSPNVKELLGYSREEYLVDPMRVLHPEEREHLEGALAQRFVSGGEGEATFRVRDAHGEWRWFENTSKTLTTANGERRVVTVSRDVTQRRNLERQLIQSQKMEAIGQLAGGIAHDFNNLLTVITGYGSQLRDGMATGPSADHALEEILGAAQRAAGLTKQLLAFGRRQSSEPRVLSLNEVVISLERMIRRVIGEHIEFVVDLASELPPVRADPGQLEQAILNLVVNARDAMPEGGRLEIRTASIDIASEEQAQGLEGPPGSYVRLLIADSGVGMDEAIRAHMFEPFFTTKEVGRGSGMGLAMVYGIVRQSGGYVSGQSEVGKGTTMSIHLPAVDEVAAEAETETEERQETSGDETILLVEDENLVRDVTAEALTRYGYTVLTARHPNEALEIVRERGEALDLLLTDVVMPQMNGPELAERLLERLPRLKVLFMSGFSGPGPDSVPFAHHTVPKPFTPHQIAVEVRKALDA